MNESSRRDGPFRQHGDILIWQAKHETLWIQPWGLDSLRVRATRGPEVIDHPWALMEPQKTEPVITIQAHDEGVPTKGYLRTYASIQNGLIEAVITSEGHLLFKNSSDGSPLLEEPPLRFMDPMPREFHSLDSDLYRIEARFQPHPGERLYGLGQHKHGFLDQKGCVIELMQRNTSVAIPFLLSNRGYGFLWNNPAIGQVELGTNGTRWVANASRQMDYWITAGKTPAEILSKYIGITGHAPLLPEWATGFWQCKLRYKTQDELLSIAHEYKQRGLPLSVIVIDFFHWTMMGDWKFDPVCWPDPAGMVKELDEMGVKLMVSIWPSVNALSSNFQEMKDRGLLVRAEHGMATQHLFLDNQPEGPVYLHFYDATHPEGRRFIWEKVRDNYYRYGIKTWWLDACEPEVYPADHDNLRYHLGNGEEIGCIYPLLHEKAFYDGMRSEGETEFVSLCRSAWVGSQRYAAAVWSGDIPSTFESLQAQVRAGLNIGLSGIPWWTTDIGGFTDGDTTTPYFRELIVRWFQYGVFCPLFRLHGFRLPNLSPLEGSPNEVWSFGDLAYGIIREILFLRERLRPYIMEQMRLAHENGTPPMRPLFFDFPMDETAWSIEDQFMFGPDVLVAPVLFEGARSRKVYLPGGTHWRDAWTEKTFAGGVWLEVDAPLEKIPVFTRGDRTLPIRVSD